MVLEPTNPGKSLSVDELILDDLRKIKDKQDKRPCSEHTVKIEGLLKSDDEQWVAINKLRAMVYMGAGATGVLAFLGSILGTYLKGH